jgi:hypothetical protein
MGTRRREGRPAPAMACSAPAGTGPDRHRAWAADTAHASRTASRRAGALKGPGRAARWPPGGQAASAAQEGARITGRPGRARCFPGGHKDSAGEAGTSTRPRPGKRSLTARGERSERPVAGTDEAAQADPAGSHAARTASPGSGHMAERLDDGRERRQWRRCSHRPGPLQTRSCGRSTQGELAPRATVELHLWSAQGQSNGRPATLASPINLDGSGDTNGQGQPACPAGNVRRRREHTGDITACRNLTHHVLARMALDLGCNLDQG